jgi:hypothetical protein
MAAGPINTEPDCDSSHLLSGTVEIDSRTVPYIDVRAEHVSAALSRVERFVQEVEQPPGTGTPGISGLTLVAPQPSDALEQFDSVRGIT